MREALPSLTPHFAGLPAVVMLQECHLPVALLADTRRMVHRLLPAYCMFANRPKRSGGKLQVVTLVHCYLAARASLVEITGQLAAVKTTPGLAEQLHVLRLIEPRTGVTLLAINVRQYQATQPAHQDALLELVTKVLTRWGRDADATVIGGDWNASLRPRHGYSGLSHIRAADERLAEWSDGSGLTCAAPREATWMSRDESRQAVLDCFFWRSKTGEPCLADPVALEAADPRLDHRVVQAPLTVEGINGMLPLEALMKPVQLRMRNWRTEADKWRRAVSAKVGNVEGEDCFERLERLKAVAYSQAKDILGVTGGRMRSFIPFHSSHFIRLQARLRLLKAAQRDIYTRKVQVTAGPSRAMRRAWDAGWHPQPAPFGNLSHLWDPQTQSWTREWLRELRLLTQRTLDEVAQLRQSELAAAAERRRLEAVDRFWKGGELRRLLHPTLPTLHTPALRAQLPDTFVVSGEAQQLSRQAYWEDT